MTDAPVTPVLDISQALIEARRLGRRTDISQLPTPDYAEALEIQQRVQSTLGPVGGFKVARRAEGAPIMAPISTSRVLPSGADVHTDDRLGIELEIGFELISDTVPDNIASPNQHFRPRIVLELVDTRLEGAESDPMMKLADMQLNAGLVVGPAIETWNGDDFGTVEGSLRCGEQQVIDGAVTVPGGSALAMLSHFLEHVGNHCGGLRQGQILITGSLSGLLYFPPGTHVLGRISGFGEVSCRLG
ncbi:hypothetical protein ACUNV4_17265 [Granulosicoccus sp. 3-233]|uniref:hypothetical protein n=1 Tax=Granulosicoccus sp. 3-233 TaxID=3417969 RepID=UPI003D355CC9